MDKLETTQVKRTQKNYTLGFKLAVVASIEKGDMTYKQAQTSTNNLWHTRTQYRIGIATASW